jgi:dTDP-4-amino-4,6-dideoxygalactose transaminase
MLLQLHRLSVRDVSQSIVYVDIDSKTININPELIEQAITDKTTAILATHVFGNPFDIDKIEGIAEKHNLKVIFESEKMTLKVKKGLEENNIYPRRYFYPSLDTLDNVKTKNTEISKDISKRILCLPLYHELDRKMQRRIIKLVMQILEPI